MRNLIAANFLRLKKDKFFLFSFFLMMAWSMMQLLAPGIEAARNPGFVLPATDALFVQYYPMIGGLCAILTGLFLGREYSDGTMRNKVIAGHSRAAVYLSGFAVSTAAGWLLNLAWILPMLVIGIPCYGMFANPLAIALYTLVSLFQLAALSAVYTALALLIPNKTNGSIAVICVFLLMLMVGSACYNQLSEPEIVQSGNIVMDQDGTVSIEKTEPYSNPAYIGGNTRRIMTFIRDCLPTGQAVQMANEEAIDVPRMLLYSTGIILLFTCTGMAVFCKKDLK